MILESAQILSTAVHKHTGLVFYKPTHVNHPCTLKATYNRSNFIWVADLALYLCEEYEFRNGKIHKSKPILRELVKYSNTIPDGNLEFAQAMPDQYKNEDVVTAYRSYYIFEKHFDKSGKLMANWYPQEKPGWYYD